jgi:four helix bundle protein
MTNKGYRNLKVYQEAHVLVKQIYQVTRKFPQTEIFGLTSQMRRAAVSVVANILEGHARAGKKEFKHFLSISNGSLVELEYYIELCRELEYITKSEHEEIEKQRFAVGSLLGGLIRYMKHDA